MYNFSHIWTDPFHNEWGVSNVRWLCLDGVHSGICQDIGVLHVANSIIHYTLTRTPSPSSLMDWEQFFMAYMYAEQMTVILKTSVNHFNTLHVNLCCHLVQCTGSPTCLQKHNDVLHYPDFQKTWSLSDITMKCAQTIRLGDMYM